MGNYIEEKMKQIRHEKEEAAAQVALQAMAKKEAASKNKGKRIVCVLLSILMVAELAVASLYSPGWLRKSGNESAETDSLSKMDSKITVAKDTQSGEVSETTPTITLLGVTINADCVDFAGQNLTVKVADMGSNEDEDGTQYHEYDISLGDEHEYDDPIELHFPCDDSENTTVTHYNSETDTWDPLVTFEDTTGNGVVAYTHSFSRYRINKCKAGDVFVVRDANTPDAHFEISSNCYKTLTQTASPIFEKTMQEFCSDTEGYRLELPENNIPNADDMAIDSTNTALTWYSLLSPLADVGMGLVELEKSPVDEILMNPKFASYTSDFKVDLSNAMTDISILTMGLQVCMDSYKYGFESETTALNTYKNVCTNAGTFYSLSTGYSSAAFTFAFLGVTAFSMSLDYAVDSAKEAQLEAVSDIFNSYYKNIKPFSKKAWYELFKKYYYEKNGDVDEIMQVVEKKIDDYSTEFWDKAGDATDEDFVFAVAESKYKNFYDITNAQKAELSEQLKIDIRQRFSKEVMPDIEKFLIEKTQEQLVKKLNKIVEPFNRTLYFEIKENVDMTSSDTTKYSGCTLAFGKGDTVIKNSEWLIHSPSGDEADDHWAEDFSCTDYAWICANEPDTLYVFASENDMNNGAEPLKTVHFELETSIEKERTTKIDLSGSSTYTWVLTEVESFGYPFESKSSVTADEIDMYYLTGVTVMDGLESHVEDVEDHLRIICPGQVVDYPTGFVYTCIFADDDTAYVAHHSKIGYRTGGELKLFDETDTYDYEADGRIHDGSNVIPEAYEGGVLDIFMMVRVQGIRFKYVAMPVDVAGDYKFSYINSADGNFTKFDKVINGGEN